MLLSSCLKSSASKGWSAAARAGGRRNVLSGVVRAQRLNWCAAPGRSVLAEVMANAIVMLRLLLFAVVDRFRGEKLARTRSPAVGRCTNGTRVHCEGPAARRKKNDDHRQTNGSTRKCSHVWTESRATYNTGRMKRATSAWQQHAGMQSIIQSKGVQIRTVHNDWPQAKLERSRTPSPPANSTTNVPRASAFANRNLRCSSLHKKSVSYAPLHTGGNASSL